jgi:hypothetical protein
MKEALLMALNVLQNRCEPDHPALIAAKAALANEALERKAENARELGLNYEPCCYGGIAHDCHVGDNCKIVKRIKAALEAKGEPVVWNEGVPAMLPKQREGETFIVSYEPKLEAKDEPVAWVCCGVAHRHDIDFYEDDINALPIGTMLYTTPPQRTWQGLTDEQFLGACQMAEAGNYMVAFQRIQQWLMENNT